MGRFLKTLKPFQEKGKEFLLSRPYALLADEMGTGKTVQVIAAISEFYNPKVGVVCPASVRLGWKQEVEECLGSSAGWDIQSYNGVVAGKMKEPFDFLVLDECHALKSMEAQRTRAVLGNDGLVRQAKHIWALSGTPVLNRPVEFYPILRTLAMPWAMPDMRFPQYAQRYCGAFFDGRAMNCRGSSRLPELEGHLKSFMLRRTKKEVAPELGEKIIRRVPLDIGDDGRKHLLDIERDNLLQNLEQHLSPTLDLMCALGEQASMRRMVGEIKVPAVCAYVRELLDTVDKVVVFAWHRDVIDNLRKMLADFSPVVHIGGLSDVQKSEVRTQFMRDPYCRVFIGQMISAGFGINGLQEVCSDAVFAELDWTPGVMGQCLDRLHRFGKGDAAVEGHILTVPGTIEAAMLGCSDGKQRVIDVLGLGT